MHQANRTSKLILAVAGFVFLSYSNNAASQASLPANCGSLDNAYGPYDYTNPIHVAEKLPIVERHHFDRGVALLEGHLNKADGRKVTPDLDYTLRAFPNHHRALYAMIRWYLEKVPQGGDRMRYTPECYFARARAFAPHDAVVVMLEGSYLYQTERLEEALARYETALRMAPNSAEIHYNAGLLYFELGQKELAVEHAKKAYELGFPLPGLRNILMRAGLWNNANAAVIRGLEPNRNSN